MTHMILLFAIIAAAVAMIFGYMLGYHDCEADKRGHEDKAQ